MGTAIIRKDCGCIKTIPDDGFVSIQPCSEHAPTEASKASDALKYWLVEEFSYGAVHPQSVLDKLELGEFTLPNIEDNLDAGDEDPFIDVEMMIPCKVSINRSNLMFYQTINGRKDFE